MDDVTRSELKQYILRLAGHLAPGEAMTAEQGELPIRETVAQVISDGDASPILVATIALELARLLDGAGIPT